MMTRRVSLRPWTSVSVFAGFFALLLPGTKLIHAQAPQASAATQAPGRLPVRRVVLYKSGVGYFEHLGKVRGNQTVTIDFTSGQLDDVLKSLTTLDLNGGRVLGVNYNSEAALDRRLGALRLPVGDDTSRVDFLSALRGARLDVRSGVNHYAGRLLSVERTSQRHGNDVAEVDVLSLVTDAGDIQTVALDPGVNVRIVEADLNQEVGRYLTLLASARDQDVRRLTISTSGNGERDLFVSYISEVPVWKATYRLVLPASTEQRKPLLQGWAIVDNTVGEDWDNVELSLVAGAPQSFVQSISLPYYVQRPVVPLPERVSMAPQTHESAISTAGPGAMAGTVTDSAGGTLPGVTVSAVGSRGVPVVASTDSSGRFELPSLALGSYDVTFELSGFKTALRRGVLVAAGMQAVVDMKLEIGALTESVTVSAGAPTFDTKSMTTGAGGGGGAGRGGGRGFSAPLAAPAAPPPPSAERVGTFRSQQQSAADAAQLGDLFEYKLKEPVTIRKNQSALVPILSGEVEAEKVSLWNANSGASRPLRAVWVTNATGLTLDGGSFSVIEGQVFAGEGLVDPLKAGEKRLLSYAADLGVRIDAKGESVPMKVTRVTVARGLVTQQTEERQRRTYTARNEDTEPRTVVIEHPVRAGWTVGGTLTPAESTAEWHRFKLPVAPKTTANFVVEETRQGQTQYSVNSITDSQIAVLVRDSLITPQVADSLRQIQSQKAEVARIGSELTARQSEIDAIGRDQDRVRENMKSLKGSAEEKQLLQRYVKQLDDQENRLEVLRREHQKLIDDRQKAQAELNRLIEALSS